MMSFAEITELSASPGGRKGAVAIAGADDEAALKTAEAGRAAGISFYLVGNPDRIRATASEFGLDIRGCEIVPPENPDGGEASECRSAAALCASGLAGVLMKGHVGTAAFTRAILDKEGGLTKPGALLSHVGFFADPRKGINRTFLLTDAAINISPDAEAKKLILANAVSVARALGIGEPGIALLAPVEKVSSKIASTSDARILKDWVAGGGLGSAFADGPFALDVAASVEAAIVKGVDTPLAGCTDIYLAPNLDAGNILYKALTVFAGALSAGILAGARVPVVLTSRADSDVVKRASLGLALRVAADSSAS